MSQIWADLRQKEESIDVLDWHVKKLEKTEEGIRKGKEHFQGWEVAKETIREA